MNQQNKFIVFAIVIVIGVTAFFIVKHRENVKPKPISQQFQKYEQKLAQNWKNEAENLKVFDLSNKLRELKQDMGQLIMKSVTDDRGKIMKLYQNVVGKYDEKKIANFVSQLSPQLKADVTLDGGTIKEPVLKMYGKNFELFEKLYGVGLIPLLGTIVAMSYWVQLSADKTFFGFSHFVKCVENINWASKDVWLSIDTTTGHVARCIQ